MKSILILPLIAVWLQSPSAIRTNNEINNCSKPCLRSQWALARIAEWAACNAPNAEN
jgi:hypothetical protein